jgi:tRNA pseudouridine32 synthase/23S rRNA pseudouridine746 synthase
MATSGVVLFALNYASQKSLGQQFEKRAIHKRYAAMLSGHLPAATGEIVMPLLCDWPNRPRQKVDWVQGKAAHTIFHVKRYLDNHSFVELVPLTGRSHQLRVHCQQLGHPIVGDSLYDGDPSGDRLMLHAEFIDFCHPQCGRRVQIHCPAPFGTW